MGFNIAIDGPAGTGKSTAAKLLSKELGFIYVDTGAMYRAIGLYMLQHGIDTADEQAVVAALPEVEVTIGFENGAQQIYLNGENVSQRIRTQEVSEAASVTSRYQKLREKLLGLQRKIAAENNAIMDGRDIGTVVLPNADVKVFLTASAPVRARRRYLELTGKGIDCDPEEIQKEIEERDYRDSHREIAPLKQADDAILLDTSEMNEAEVVDAIRKLIPCE